MHETVPGRPAKAADVVMKHIEMLILEGSLKPGDALLPERELALRLNVSRPTLRDALKSLREKGMLTERHGKGLAVAQLGATTITDPLISMLAAHSDVADHYLEFRDVVESSAAAMAAHRATEVDLERIRACIARIERAHIANDAHEEAEADTDLHLAIYEASHNLVLLQIMRALSGNLRTDVLRNRQNLFTIPDVRELLRDQHRAIANAILERRAEDALSAAHAHIAFLRHATQDVQKREEKLQLARRRQAGGGLSIAEG